MRTQKILEQNSKEGVIMPPRVCCRLFNNKNKNTHNICFSKGKRPENESNITFVVEFLLLNFEKMTSA